MFLFDVLEHSALLQALPVEYGLARVLGQAHLLEPLNEVAAKEAVNSGGLPTPDGQRKHKGLACKKESVTGAKLGCYSVCEISKSHGVIKRNNERSHPGATRG